MAETGDPSDRFVAVRCLSGGHRTPHRSTFQSKVWFAEEGFMILPIVLLVSGRRPRTKLLGSHSLGGNLILVHEKNFRRRTTKLIR